MPQRQFTFISDGSIKGTVIAVDGVKMDNVKSFKLEGDANDPFLTLTVTLYALKDAVAVEASGPMDFTQTTPAP